MILFNRGSERATLSFSWEDAAILPEGKAFVRDLWRGADEGVFEKRYEASVEPHGVVLVKVTPRP
jgi:alpha-galactosidase